MEETTQFVELEDGRKLGYSEFGDLNGIPIFHFHGYPGSRLEAYFGDFIAKKYKVRFIGLDRPGMGISDFQPTRTLLDWPDDVIELADALKIDKFRVEGISGGGPYSAACAYKIPDRLLSCGIIGGLGPADMSFEGMMKSNRRDFFVMRRLPWLYRLLMWATMGRKSKDVESVEKMMLKGAKNLPEPDRKILQNPELRKPFARESLEAFRQGTKGPAYEGKIYAKPWGFSLEDISPNLKVYIWHGELDVNVPIGMGREMAKRIPNCIPKFYHDEAHLSAAFNHLDEIVKTLIS